MSIDDRIDEATERAIANARLDRYAHEWARRHGLAFGKLIVDQIVCTAELVKLETTIPVERILEWGRGWWGRLS